MSLGKLSVTTAAVAAALALSACGGGGGGSSSGSVAPPSGSNISGKAIDGYLKNAKVCVDRNADGACGDGEPSATTGAGGNYTLSGATKDDIGKNLLVLIGTDTIDEARPNHKFTAQTPLIRHLDKLKGELHITPLTTMVAAEIAKGSTLGSAQEIVKSALGIENTNVDYTGTTSIETKAQTLVDAMQQAAASGKLDVASALAAASALTKNPNETNIGNIVSGIASNKEEIELMKLLATSDWYDGESGKWQTSSGSVAGYIGISGFSDDKATFRSKEWNGKDWEWGSDGKYEQIEQKKGGGWVYIPRGTEEFETILERGYDASTKKVTFKLRRELTGQIFNSEFDKPEDLSGKPVKDYLLAIGGNPVNPDMISSVDATLPAGSIYITGNAIPVDPEVSVSLYTGKDCGDKPRVISSLTDPKGVKHNVEHCSYLGTHGQAYTRIDQAIGLVVDGYYEIAADNKLLAASMQPAAPKPVVGSWEYATGLDGKQLIRLKPETWEEPETRPVVVLNEETGLLQKGYMWLPGGKEAFDHYNKTMLDKMLAVYETLLDRVLSVVR